jgi:hypothetical protein
LGEASRAIKITSVAYKATSLVVDADVSQDGPASTVELRTNEKPLQAHGAKLRLVSGDRYELVVDPVLTAGAHNADSAANPAPAAGEYRHVEIIVDFAGRAGR